MICTKGEILEKHYRNYKKRIAYEENVFKAMDEYAKQEQTELITALKTIKDAFWTDGETYEEQVLDLKAIAVCVLHKNKLL